MIKVFYIGYGVVVNYEETMQRGYKPMAVTDCIGTIGGDLVRLNREIIESKPTDEFMLTNDDEITILTMGFAEIGLLSLCENKELALMITDKKGTSCPIKINNLNSTYPPEENNGNALKLIFDDDAPPVQQDIEPPEKPFNESERTTMLKLIYGMAIDSYGYDPQKSHNEATGNNKNSISSKLALRGFNVSDTTIRGYLKEAKELFK